mgnify:CR=1 FL=1
MTKNIGRLLTTLHSKAVQIDACKKNTNKSSEKSLTKEQMCGIM